MKNREPYFPYCEDCKHAVRYRKGIEYVDGCFQIQWSEPMPDPDSESKCMMRCRKWSRDDFAIWEPSW